MTVKRLEAAPGIDLHYSYRTLKGMSAEYDRRNIAVLGLTRGKAFARISARSVLRRDPTRQWECASHQVSVEYGFVPITIYIGREFPPDSCAYRQILEHEQQHVRTYLEYARRIEPEIAAALRQRFDTGEPARGAAGTTQQRLQQEINERWAPYIKRLLEDVRSEQRAVDSPEEYARIAGSCDGAIRKQMETAR